MPTCSGGRKVAISEFHENANFVVEDEKRYQMINWHSWASKISVKWVLVDKEAEL